MGGREGTGSGEGGESGWKESSVFFHSLMSEQDLSMFKGRRQRKDGELGSYKRDGLMGDTPSQRWGERGHSPVVDLASG